MRKNLYRKKPLWKMSTGVSEFPLLFFVIGLSIILVGGFLISYHPEYSTSLRAGLCCNSGDGNQCVPQNGTGQTLQFTSPTSLTFPQYKGISVQYDLLKSHVKIIECFKHGKDSKQTVTYVDGKTHPIVYNNSQELAGKANECRDPGFDQIADFRSGTKICSQIPDDELIYVCVANCEAPFGTVKPNNSCDPTAHVYGNDTTIYDVYFRHADYPSPGIPDVIKNCSKGVNPSQTGITPTSTVFNPYAEHKTLQLHTFLFEGGGEEVLEPRPFCKPALYLYPPQPEQVHVAIAPKGKVLLTIPQYPITGWNVLAHPNGEISYENTTYDYLFYEAQIPDTLLSEQPTGYVVAYDKLSEFFATLLPKLGLNQKEQLQFSQYWLKALPNSPYYKISLVPETTLDTISPLTIIPKPDSILRVDLNFEPLDKKITISPPVLTPFIRSGFTVVEWGGMFKQDKNHPFTCLM